MKFKISLNDRTAHVQMVLGHGTAGVMATLLPLTLMPNCLVMAKL